MGSGRLAVVAILLTLFFVGIAAADVPITDFTANITTGAPPLTVQFNSTSINATSWNWSFGDGALSVDENPLYTYTVAGTYTVILNATNGDGSNATTKSGYISINATPTPTPTPVWSDVRYTTTHLVRFMCKDWSGAPIQNMNVSVIGVQSSLGSLDWIPTFFGINLNNTPILNTTMNATTDSGGSVVFLMIPVEKYRLDYTYAPLGISESRYYYPKEDRYEEVFWTTEAPTTYALISFSLFNATNGSYADLTVIYNDTSTSTDNFTFWVENRSGTIYTYHAPASLGMINVSYPIPITNDGIYYWGFSANSTRFEDRINASYYFRIEGAGSGLMLDLGIGTDAGALAIYNWFSIAIIMIIAFLFSKVTIKFAVVIVPIMALFLRFIGWMSTTWLLLGIAISLGIFWYFRFSESDVTWV